MKKENETETRSLSQQRKQQRKEEIARKKKMDAARKIIWIAVGVVVLGLIIWAIVSSAIKKANSVTMNTNYSEQLNGKGMIKNVKAADYIDLADYNNITASLSDIEYSDESVDNDIKSVLNEHQYLDDSAELVAADGDKVNIDYAGSIDGIAFDGGTAEGYDIVLGSQTFIDDFEAQIEGHKPGDSFDVEVTFPEDYSNNPDLAGCDAVFAVTLNGIYQTPEFTDEFVAENLSEYASTVEEYRQYLKDKNYEANLIAFAEDYVVDNSTLKSAPKKYLKQLKGNYKAYEYSNYEYMNTLYNSYYGYTVYDSFASYLSQYYSMTEEQYDASLEERVNQNLMYSLACQAIAEKEGITVDLDEARDYYLSEGGTAEDFETQLSNYGEGYLVQQYLDVKVIDLVKEHVTVK